MNNLKLVDDVFGVNIMYDAKARRSLGCVIMAVPNVRRGQRVTVNQPLFTLETNRKLTRLKSPIAGMVEIVNDNMHTPDCEDLFLVRIVPE